MNKEKNMPKLSDFNKKGYLFDLLHTLTGRESTCAIFAQVQTEGSRDVTRQIEYYNFDAIIAVGYSTDYYKNRA